MAPVFDNSAEWITEHGDRFIEGDAMLDTILACLMDVPFEPRATFHLAWRFISSRAVKQCPKIQTVASARSTNRHSALISRICSIVRARDSSSSGLATTTARHIARDTPTLRRLREKRNWSERGTSSALDVHIESKSIGATRPWNWYTVGTDDESDEVHGLVDGAARVGNHPPRAREEHAHLRRDGRGSAEQVLQHRRAGPRRMRALRHLGELERIAEQDHVARGRPHRERVGQRDLPRLVDHERVDGAVEILVGEEPGRAREQPDVRPGARERVDTRHIGDRTALVERLVVAIGRLLEAL